MSADVDLARRRLWWIAIGLSLAPAVSNGLARFAYGLILPSMRDDLSWSFTQAGWINTVNAIGYLVGALAAFALLRRMTLLQLFVGGLVLATLSLCGSALTRDFWLQSLFRLLAGIGGAPLFIAGGAFASMLFRGDPSRNAMSIGLFVGGGGLGMLLSGAVLPPLFAHRGAAAWPAAWGVLALLAALSLWPAILAARAAAREPQDTATRDDARLPTRRMGFALAGYFLFAVGYIVYLTFLVAWMRSNAAPPVQVAITWSVLGAAVMASPFLWRPALTRAHGGGALALACLATALGTLLPLAFSGFVGVLVSAAIFGGSFFIGPASVTAFGRKNLPQAAWGPSMALFTIVFATGQTIGPVAAGALADSTGTLDIGFTVAGGILALGGFVALLQKPLRQD